MTFWRWKKTRDGKNVKSGALIKVNRERVELKSGKSSREESYYVSNEVGKYEELSEAVRRHWQVETNNHLRDVSLKEDEMRSKKSLKSNNGRNKNIGNGNFTENKLSE